MRALILGGLGIHLIDGAGLPEEVAAALEAPRKEVTDPVGRQFRVFAEQTKSDLRALAACIRGSRQTLPREEAQTIRAPTLILVGDRDQFEAVGKAGHHPAVVVADHAGTDEGEFREGAHVYSIPSVFNRSVKARQAVRKRSGPE